MSNRLAIAAVTLTLRNLIQAEVQQVLGGARVTTVPPDRAREGNEPDQINLFMYQTTPNAALRNRGVPGQTAREGEQTWLSPLALDLHYLVTAYGADHNAANDHRLLGGAMKALHDHPVLTADDIRAALPESDLQNQIERVRITLESPSTEEMSKLWSTFQSQYRISAAYLVSVVLIESTRPPKAALPVLKRGAEDRGIPALAAPFQSITEVVPPRPFSTARLGDELTIRGTQLGAANAVVRFSNRRLAAPIEREALPGPDDGTIIVRIAEGPDDPGAADWVSGLYSVALVIRSGNLPTWTSNEVPFVLAPILRVQPTNLAVGDVLTVTPAPPVRQSQREHVLLLLGNHQVRMRPADAAHPPQPEPPDLHFVVPLVRSGTYIVRLRVDGAESHAYTLTGAGQLAFDPAQTVTIT